MIREIPLAPRAMAFAVTVLVLGLCRCSLCGSFGPLANAPDVSPTVAATHVASATHAASATPEVTQNTVRETHLDATYHDATGFFTVRYPRTWDTHRSGSEMQFWADDQGAAGVAVSIQVKATSPEQMLDEVAGLLANKSAGYQEASRRQAVVDGFRAIWVEHTYDWDGVPQRGFMVGAVRNRVGYLLLAFSLVEQYPDLEPAFRAIADSLHVVQFAAAPPYDQWLTYKGAYATFHYLPETYAAAEIGSIAAAHERVLEQNARSLAVDYLGPIRFFLYPSEACLYRATARTVGFAIAEAGEVHARWYSADDHQSLGHEMTHVIAHATLGEPGEALLGEGIAVCLDHAEPHPHARAAALLQAGHLVPLSDLLGEDWFAHDAAVAYAESGSVVCWLLEQDGADRFKQLYPRRDFATALIEIYGFDLETLQAEWRSVLQAISANPHPSFSGQLAYIDRTSEAR